MSKSNLRQEDYSFHSLNQREREQACLRKIEDDIKLQKKLQTDQENLEKREAQIFAQNRNKLNLMAVTFIQHFGILSDTEIARRLQDLERRIIALYGVDL